jgi:hypothetical protein
LAYYVGPSLRRISHGSFASQCPEFEGIRLFEKLTNG